MSVAAGALRAAYAGRIGGFELDAVFEAPLAGVTGLFGPSGSGKTVLLRCIAGLTRLRGRLTIGDDVWETADGSVRRAPHERQIGYVFQEASLFAHLSVRDNLLYGHRRALRAVPEMIRPDDAIGLLGIEQLLDRSPHHLSGGERQRVALGRALLSQPRLLLMDEPLAALDRMAKDEILPYIEAVHRALTIPVLYVTHDIDEIERLADHLVLLEAGRVIASGPLADVLADPRTPLARGPSAATVLEAQIASYDAGDMMTTLAIPGGTLLVPGHLGAIGSRRRVRVAAQDVSLAIDLPSRTTILNVLPARIADIQPLDAGRANVLLALGPEPGSAGGPEPGRAGGPEPGREGGTEAGRAGEPEGRGASAKLLARITQRSLRALALAPGQTVHAQIKAASIVDPRSAFAPPPEPTSVDRRPDPSQKTSV
jgi:molybdate transport system ATP-binding protein